MAVGLEQQRIEFGPAIALIVDELHFALALAQRIDDLVLEDADQPGLELAAVAEGLGFGQGGQQRLGDGVLRPRIVAQLQAREPQQVAALLGNLVFECGDAHPYGMIAQPLDETCVRSKLAKGCRVVTRSLRAPGSSRSCARPGPRPGILLQRTGAAPTPRG